MDDHLHQQEPALPATQKKSGRSSARVSALLLLLLSGSAALALAGGTLSQNPRQQGSLTPQGCIAANRTAVACPPGFRLLLAQISYHPASATLPSPGGDGSPTDPLTGGACSAAGCPDLFSFMQEWTRWLSWILGGFGILWVLAGFYRGTEPHLSYAGAGDGPWRRILLRLFEAGLVFFIAWRIGDIAMLIENILAAHHDLPTIQGNTEGILGPPHQAVAQLIGLSIGLMVQIFLIYILPRVAFQCMSAIGMMISGRAGMFFLSPGSAQLQMAALSSVVQLIGLAIGIVAAPPILIWFFVQVAR